MRESKWVVPVVAGLLGAAACTSGASRGAVMTVPAVSTTAAPPVTTHTPTTAAAPGGLEEFAFEVGGSGLRFLRPASWRVLEVMQPTMAFYAMLSNGPSHPPCNADMTSCGSPVDAIAPGQIVVQAAVISSAATGAELVSEQLERLKGVDATISGRPVRIERTSGDGCLPGAERAVIVSVPAELPEQRVTVAFCWRGPDADAIGAEVGAAIASMTLAPMTTGVAVPSPDHWPIAGEGEGWQLRAQRIAPFECLRLDLDGREQAQACFHLAEPGLPPTVPVQVGLMTAIDGKRFAYGVIEGADTLAVIQSDGDAPQTVDAQPVDGVRVFVAPVARFVRGTCEAFTLATVIAGERPTVLPPVCRGDEADLYVVTRNTSPEDGRMINFRRNADGTWRVASDPWGGPGYNS